MSSAIQEKAQLQRGQASVKGSTETMRMVLLAFSAVGITFTWGFEMTYCTPYLLNLGLTKSGTSLVWIAGPISGLIMQPLVGAVADKSTSRFGRRRPFMVAGSLIVATSLLLLGFTREVVGLFLEGEAAAKVTIWLAVLSIWVIDFAINASMSCSRSLVVDVLPIHKQQIGASWYSRLAAFGNVLGYSIGSLDLVAIFGPSFGDTQFKKLSLVATFAVLFTCSVTCWAVTEKVLEPRKDADGKVRGGGVGAAVQTIVSTLRNLPPRVRAICWAHFWSWIDIQGWFPFNFYGTTWVGETYFRYDLPPSERASKDALSQMGRIGSTSLVIYSSITLTSSFLLPLLVRSPDETDYTPRPPRSLERAVGRFERIKPDLLTGWLCAHLGFSASMMMAPFATSYKFATFLVALCGMPWAMTQWAPPTFLGIEVNRLSGADTLPTHKSRATSEKPSPSQSPADNHTMLSPAPGSPAPNPEGELSGIYFGILNIFSTIPQFMGAVMSGTIFYLLDAGKSPELAEGEAPVSAEDQDGPNAISVCLFIGALCALVSAYMTRQLKYVAP